MKVKGFYVLLYKGTDRILFHSSAMFTERVNSLDIAYLFGLFFLSVCFV